MNEKDNVPEGYEVETDMFGFPFLQRKQTPEEKRAERILLVPGLLLIAAVIWWILSL